jgi:vacuolar-type H+-ATPase subunit E/Vma4
VRSSGRTATRQREGLVPVQEALLAAARSQAEQILATAQQAAREVLGQAQAQAEEIRAQARARGEANGADLIAAARSRAGRQARAVVLAAVRAEYEALREAARNAVAGLTDDPDYQFVRRRMTVSLRRLLGEEAQVHDAAGGGVVATVPGRSADLSLARLADRAVEDVLAEESPVELAARAGVA